MLTIKKKVMTPKKVAPKTIIQVLLLICGTISLTFFNSCQKQANTEGILFTSSDAKEWYYASFKKSPEYLSYDSKLNGKKLPDWAKGVYKKVGDIEIIEFPLKQEKTTVRIPEADRLSDIEKKQISAASLFRIAFIKNKKNNLVVRELNYLPEIQYLRNKNYDISQNSFANFDKNFSGRLIIKDWSGKEISRNIIKDGKVSMKSHLIKQGSNKNKIVNSAKSSSNSEIICDQYIITEYEQFCSANSLYGDEMNVINCTDWAPTGVQYMEEGECYESNPCTNMSQEECLCQLYSICPNDGNNNNEEEENCDNKLDELVNSAVVSDETVSITTISSTPTTRTKKYEWIILKSIGWHIFSWEKGVHVKVNNPNPNLQWKWQSLEHLSIGVVGMVVGGAVEPTVNTAIPTIGLYNSGMDINFSVKYSIVCPRVSCKLHLSLS
jgi:hypothetical protein